MLLCPETFQSWAFGLCSVLTWVEALTTVYILGNSLRGGWGSPHLPFQDSLVRHPCWSCECAAALCDLEAAALPGYNDCLVPGHLPGPHQLPLSDPWQLDTTTAAPLGLSHEERGCFKVFALFKWCSWKFWGFISFILLPLENNTQTNKTTNNKNCGRILQKKTLLSAWRPSPLCKQGSASSPVWHAACWRVWSKYGTNSAMNYFSAKMNFV